MNSRNFPIVRHGIRAGNGGRPSPVVNQQRVAELRAPSGVSEGGDELQARAAAPAEALGGAEPAAGSVHEYAVRAALGPGGTCSRRRGLVPVVVEWKCGRIIGAIVIEKLVCSQEAEASGRSGAHGRRPAA